LADILDEPELLRDVDSFLGPQLWREAELMLPVLKQALSDEFRDVLINAFSEGKALGWLTSILRRETFAHGLYGDQERPEHEWILSQAELEAIIPVIVRRFEGVGLEGVLSLPEGLSALFGWMQAGQDEKVKELIARKIESDEGLVGFLERLATTTRSSAGDYQSIRPDTLQPLTDYEIAQQRISDLAARSDDLGVRARRLKDLFAAARY
jgi:hypothetical protein